jgi:SAM-dependent methyltransferase
MDLREMSDDTGGEERHPWEVARARFFCDLLARRGVLATPLRVLDAGAGDGYLAGRLASMLPPGGSVVCFDPEYTDQHLRRLRGNASAPIAFVRDIPEGAFDLLLLLDVVEHVADDSAFIAALVGEHLRGAGLVLISVPAWMALFTRHDVALGHHRRYRPAELRGLVLRAGLEPLVTGGLFHSLLIPRALEKLRELSAGVRSQPCMPFVHADRHPFGLGRWRRGGLVSRAVAAALSLDAAVSLRLATGGLDVPGLSHWALCRKR